MQKILFMEDFKMRKYSVYFMQSIAFLMILVTSLYFINQILMPKYILKNSTWPTTSSYNQFYKMNKDSIDVLFFGSSVAVNAFSPQEIYNSYGIRSYNLGSEQQSIFLSYFWLKEALRFQSPQVVVLDTRFLFELHPENPINTTEGLTRKCLDPMKWSAVKIEAVSNLCDLDQEQSELSYYLTNIRFHTRWANLKEHDMVGHEVQYSQLKGYGPIDEYGAKTYKSYNPSGDTEARANAHGVMMTYLDKTAELCREEGITLVLVSLPGNAMNDGVNNLLSAYAQSNQIDYYNLCETKMYNSIGAELPRENMIGHENLWGSIKMSRFIGNLLSSTYEVAAVEDPQYEESRDFYEQIKKNCELKHITDLDEYLKMIQDPNYTIFMAVRDEASAGLTESVKKELKSLGLREDLTDKYEWSYCAVISPENGVREELSRNDRAVISGSIRGGKTFYTVTSGGYAAGGTGNINIDGSEYSRNKDGLNIVVYDNYLMKVIDRVTFDTNGTCNAKR